MCTAAVGGSSYAIFLREESIKAYESGYSIHGALGIGIDQFSERLISIIRKCSRNDCLPAMGEFVSRLHATDLYLSTACALNDERAWERFGALYSRYMNDLVTYICSTRSIALEIRETVAAHLFLPDGSGHSRIASYDGRSSLATWLRVIVTNRIINEGQRKCNTLRYDQPRPDIEDGAALPCIETRLKISRYETLVCAAVRSACETLTDLERELLLSRFDRQVQLGKIAQKYNVHQSTITRTLDRIFRKIRENLISNLGEMQLGGAAIDECLSIVRDGECQSVSILDCLRGGDTDSAKVM